MDLCFGESPQTEVRISFTIIPHTTLVCHTGVRRMVKNVRSSLVVHARSAGLIGWDARHAQ
jgi:hypothetical protein